MSHDIYAFKGAKKERQVAWICIRPGEEADSVYTALQAMDCYAKNTGNGGEKILLAAEFSRAHDSLQQKGTNEEILHFLKTCAQASDAVTLVFL